MEDVINRHNTKKGTEMFMCRVNFVNKSSVAALDMEPPCFRRTFP